MIDLILEVSSNVLKLPHATPETKDAAQYMIYKGKKQFNFCGQLCVAYCMQDEAHTDNIDDFIAYWEVNEQKWWQTIFNSGLSRGTTIYDLNKMLSAYGVGTQYPPAFAFNSISVTPQRVSSQLMNYQAIIGVSIDSGGYLVGQGIRHWVVLDDIIVFEDQTRAMIKIYNPFTNNEEMYSWRELMTSTGYSKVGLWIDRA